MESFNSSFNLVKGKNYFLICYSLVSGGKSTFFKIIQNLMNKDQFQNEYNVFYVSSDEVRDELAKNFQKKNPELNYQQCFDKVGKNTAKEFDKRISIFIKNKHKNKNKINLILVDKNYPQGIDKFLNNFVEKEKKNNFAIIFLPDIKNPISLNENHINYPFSIDYVIQCFLRLKHRKNHENLNGDDENSRNVYFSFLRCFQGFKFESSIFSEQYKNNVEIKRIPFTDEDNNLVFNEIHQNFFNVLKNIKPFDMNQINNFYKEDIDKYINYIITNYDEKNLFKDTRQRIENFVLNFLNEGLLNNNTNNNTNTNDTNDNTNNNDKESPKNSIESDMEEKEKINDIIQKYFKAIESKDVQIIDEIFSKTKCALIKNNKIYDGIESIKNDFILGGLSKQYKEIKIIPVDININKMDSHNLYLINRFKIECFLNDNEQFEEFEEIETHIMKKEDNEWKIIHIHK